MGAPGVVAAVDYDMIRLLITGQLDTGVFYFQNSSNLILYDYRKEVVVASEC